MVSHAVATAISLIPMTGQPIIDELARVLRPRQILLVLDTCEHLLAAASLVAALLSACPALQVLTTSRGHLWVRGEYEMDILPFQVPPVDPVREPVLLADNEAVRLLGAAAIRAQTGLAIAPSNRDEHRAGRERAQELVGEAAFVNAWAQGESLTLDEAVTEANAVLAQAAQVDTRSDTVRTG